MMSSDLTPIFYMKITFSFYLTVQIPAYWYFFHTSSPQDPHFQAKKAMIRSLSLTEIFKSFKTTLQLVSNLRNQHNIYFSFISNKLSLLGNIILKNLILGKARSNALIKLLQILWNCKLCNSIWKTWKKPHHNQQNWPRMTSVLITVSVTLKLPNAHRLHR